MEIEQIRRRTQKEKVKYDEIMSNGNIVKN